MIKKHKFTILFAGVVMFLGVFTYLDFRGIKKEKEKERKKSFIEKSVSPEDIIAFNLKSEKAHFFKKKDEWQLQGEPSYRLDQKKIKDYLRAVLETEVHPISKELSEKDYDLTEISKKIFLKTKDKEFFITVSNKKAFDGSFYLKKTSDEGISYFVGDGKWGTRSQRTLVSFKQARVFYKNLNIWKVIMTSSDKNFFVKKQDRWTSPYIKNIHTENLDSFLRDLQDLKGDRVESESKKDLKRFDLKNPKSVISISGKSKGSPEHIRLIFSSAKKGKVYFASSHRKEIFSFSEHQSMKIFRKREFFTKKEEKKGEKK